MDTLTVILFFLLIAGVAYFATQIIAWALAQLNPPKEVPSWLMALLALLAALFLVYVADISLTPLPFVSVWQQVASVIVFWVAGLALARRV